MSEGYQPNGPATNEVTPPNYGSNVQERSKRLTIKCLDDDIETSINDYVNSFDPCSMCANKTETGHKITCHDCAYFYAGQFKARREA